MSYTVVKPKDRDAWLIERKKGLGSSDAGTIMQISPFSTPLKLWRQKMGIDPPTPETDAMRNGHFFEASTAEYFAAVTKSYVDPTTAGDWLAVSNEKPWLRVSPDRLFWIEGVEHTPENALILELKSTNKIVDPDNIPLYWFCQVQYQMGVMGKQMAAVAWVSAMPNLNFGHTWIPFNPSFYKTLEEKLDFFWNENIQKSIAPDPITEEDANILWPKGDATKSVFASQDDLDLLEQYKQLSERLEEAKTDLSLVVMQIKERMEDATSLVKQEENGGCRTLVTYKHNRKNVFDTEKFQNEDPKTYKKYCVSTLDINELKTFDKKTWDKYNVVTQGPRVFKVL